MKTTPVLRAEDLSFAYPGQEDVLRGVSLELMPGGITTLLGPNGAGKSTLLNCLSGLVRPQHGRVELEGRDIYSLRSSDIAQRLAYVPQSTVLSFGYTVREYIVMGRAPHRGMFSLPSEADYAKADEAAAALGVSRLLGKLCTELSGGEKQLINVCRAIAQEPAAILFDEPTSALDYGNQLRVLRLVRSLAGAGYAILMTTHNPEHPLLLGGSAAVLDREGRLTCGPAEAMITPELLSGLYGETILVEYSEAAGRRTCVCAPLG